MRPYLPPARAVKLCNAGMIGTIFEAPTVLVFNVLYLAFGDNWLNIFMPGGIPVGPVIIAILFTLFAVTYVRKIYVYKTIKWVRRFRRLAIISSVFTVFLAVFNVYELIQAPNPDVFASYLATVIFMFVILCQAALLLWTIHKYHWYNPDSRPEEWELPEAIARQGK